MMKPSEQSIRVPADIESEATEKARIFMELASLEYIPPGSQTTSAPVEDQQAGFDLQEAKHIYNNH